MSKNLYISVLLGLVLVTIGSGFWYYGNIYHNPAIVVKNPITPVSDTTDPFSSGKMIFDTTHTQSIWETSSGKSIFFNTNWMGRTVEIDGKPVHYQFGSGNPIETDKSIEELLVLSHTCSIAMTDSCSLQELVGTQLDGSGNSIPDKKPSRMTPEIEYLVYSFLSNPIIRQSSESCSEYFFTYSQAYSIFGPGIGDTIDTNWWNPYNININDIIIINSTTGRKELNLERISTLNTQLQIPSELQGGLHYTNVPLRACLQKNNQLYLLQSHVASHYERLRQAWYGN